MKNKKAFTLIELIAVLVILAILALIVTPLVLNIIIKARIAADKRSIDDYGRSIELAIADYLLENGTFPTSIDQLTIEYTGDRVVCSTTRLNNNSSVYLAECTVNNREVAGYTYGKEEVVTYDAYEIGDEVTYKGINFYVIERSDEAKETVTLLKAEPLSVEEITETGAHATEYAGYGYEFMTYNTEYESSDIKTIVDTWVTEKLSSNDYEEARLITLDDLINNLGYEYYVEGTESFYRKTESTPSWIYNNQYGYWTMTSKEDSNQMQWWYVGNSDKLGYSNYNGDSYFWAGSNYYVGYAVRPVIVLKKSVL